MRWPWSRCEPLIFTKTNRDRATLTLLDGDRYIIGFPEQVHYAQSEEIAHRWQRWFDGGQAGPLVLPYAVDFVDARTVRS